MSYFEKKAIIVKEYCLGTSSYFICIGRTVLFTYYMSSAQADPHKMHFTWLSLHMVTVHTHTHAYGTLHFTSSKHSCSPSSPVTTLTSPSTPPLLHSPLWSVHPVHRAHPPASPPPGLTQPLATLVCLWTSGGPSTGLSSSVLVINPPARPRLAPTQLVCTDTTRLLLQPCHRFQSVCVFFFPLSLSSSSSVLLTSRCLCNVSPGIDVSEYPIVR